METVSCIFCGIARKEASASIVYEDDKVIAFLDIRPLNEGHTLVIPKEHYETVYDIPDDLIAQIYKIVKRTAVAVKNATKADGITIIQQNGHAAGRRFSICTFTLFQGMRGRSCRISGTSRTRRGSSWSKRRNALGNSLEPEFRIGFNPFGHALKPSTP